MSPKVKHKNGSSEGSNQQKSKKHKSTIKITKCLTIPCPGSYIDVLGKGLQIECKDPSHLKHREITITVNPKRNKEADQEVHPEMIPPNPDQIQTTEAIQALQTELDKEARRP
ncbi:MAG: hypothetical protein GEU26_11720 [Nitrososphaeraceae archaeon]|nr:hypothetical protein [Nitrososphaeraceae archaeon]